MAVTLTWKRTDTLRKHKVVMLKYTYGNGDTTITAATGLKLIYAWSVSPTSVVDKQVRDCDVSGGTITITVTDPLGTCYLTVTAIGI